MSKNIYKTPNRFINREKEQDYFLKYFWELPRNILFVYWPKSTGKTTLMKKVIKKLDEKKYAISYLIVTENRNKRKYRKIKIQHNFKNHFVKEMIFLMWNFMKNSKNIDKKV